MFKNFDEMREFLAEQLRSLRAEEVSPSSANASANVAGKIISSVKTQCEYNKLQGKTPYIKMLED